MFSDIFTQSHWIENRDAWMDAARDCRATLTNPEGYWRYSQDEERLKRAVGVWVAKAREAHKIALARRSLIRKAVVIDGGLMAVGSLDAA